MLGSGFYTGYIPFASGTFGSLAALFIYCIPGFEKIPVLAGMIVLFIILGLKIGDKFDHYYGKDPSECTIDEFVGMWITLLFVPKKLEFLILSFVIWRIFDIIKPFPARNMELLPGGMGIMMDDIVSAIYSLITVHVIILLIPLLF